LYQIRQTSKFKKDIKRLTKQGRDLKKMETVVNVLSSGKALGAEYLDHPLTSNWKGFRDCHIEPDWILLYKIEADILVLTLTRTGSHSELEL
jgi:mRNA interferase YafQ